MDGRGGATSTPAHRMEKVFQIYLYVSLVFINFVIYNYDKVFLNFKRIKK